MPTAARGSLSTDTLLCGAEDLAGLRRVLGIYQPESRTGELCSRIQQRVREQQRIFAAAKVFYRKYSQGSPPESCERLLCFSHGCTDIPAVDQHLGARTAVRYVGGGLDLELEIDHDGFIMPHRLTCEKRCNGRTGHGKFFLSPFSVSLTRPRAGEAWASAFEELIAHEGGGLVH
jgi:hypothetical protein